MDLDVLVLCTRQDWKRDECVTGAVLAGLEFGPALSNILQLRSRVQSTYPAVPQLVTVMIVLLWLHSRS